MEVKITKVKNKRYIESEHLPGTWTRSCVLAPHSILALGFRRDRLTFADMVQAMSSPMPALRVARLSEPGAVGTPNLDESQEHIIIVDFLFLK